MYDTFSCAARERANSRTPVYTTTSKRSSYDEVVPSSERRLHPGRRFKNLTFPSITETFRAAGDGRGHLRRK